jgi:glycosyltransferase involved in cell wall biosynthesis
MPEHKLVVASGGSQYDALRRIAGSASNIHFTNWVTDEELSRLMGNAVACLYISTDEDFGMSPVEAMAAEKPVVGVAAGGLLETVVPGETGILLSPRPTPSEISAAIKELSPEKAASMRTKCRQRAEAYSESRFLAVMSQLVYS